MLIIYKVLEKLIFFFSKNADNKGVFCVPYLGLLRNVRNILHALRCKLSLNIT